MRCLRSGCKDLAFCRYAEEPDDHNNVEKRGAFPEPGTYNVKIDVQLATGERPCVYEGKLLVEKAVVTDPLTWDKINALCYRDDGRFLAIIETVTNASTYMMEELSFFEKADPLQIIKRYGG